MSRLRRLYTILACRTGLRTGKSVKTSGRLPLTRSGTFGKYPLPDYAVQGGARFASDPSPSSPVVPAFVGEAALPGGERGVSLVLSTADAAGEIDRFTVTLPGVEPLRAVSGVYDELVFGSGKLIRRVGVCLDPGVFPGLASTYGSAYPSVLLLVGDGTTVADHPDLTSTHWKKLRASELTDGIDAGMLVRNGALYANLPRALYRRYVTGATGATTVGSSALTSSVTAGEYRCDFFDGTSRVFTLPEPLDGCEGCRDVLAVSRSGATLKKRTLRYAFTGEENVGALPDYQSSGETLFVIAKSGFGADGEGVATLAAGAVYADMTPYEMIETYPADPALSEDGDNWYVHVPGKQTVADFLDYLGELAQAGTPLTLVYPAAEATETVLTSRLADAETVTDVPTLTGTVDDTAFDTDAALTLVPAMREFLSDESAQGRPVRIYYALPDCDVTETEIGLPTLHAGEGSTVFSATAAGTGGLDPVLGYFVSLAET